MDLVTLTALASQFSSHIFLEDTCPICKFISEVQDNEIDNTFHVLFFLLLFPN